MPLLYLRARDRHRVLDEAADDWWRLRTTGAFVSHDVPGNHFTCMEPPHVSEVADLIRAHLADDGAPNDAACSMAMFRAILDAFQRTDLECLRRLFWHADEAVFFCMQVNLEQIGWPQIDQSLQRQCAAITTAKLDLVAEPRVKISGRAAVAGPPLHALSGVAVSPFRARAGLLRDIRRLAASHGCNADDPAEREPPRHQFEVVGRHATKETR